MFWYVHIPKRLWSLRRPWMYQSSRLLCTDSDPVSPSPKHIHQNVINIWKFLRKKLNWVGVERVKQPFTYVIHACSGCTCKKFLMDHSNRLARKNTQRINVRKSDKKLLKWTYLKNTFFVTISVAFRQVCFFCKEIILGTKFLFFLTLSVSWE